MSTKIQSSLNEALTIMSQLYKDLKENPEEIITNMDNETWHMDTCKLVTDICYAGKDLAEIILSSLDAGKSVDSLFKGRLDD